MTGEYRLYQDLAVWWPLISPPGEYAEEAAYLAAMFSSAALPVREVLDLGSGGGHVAAGLKGRLALTLVDLSEQMLAVSRDTLKRSRNGRTIPWTIRHSTLRPPRGLRHEKTLPCNLLRSDSGSHANGCLHAKRALCHANYI